MIPSAVSSRLIQYKGFLRILSPNLDNVQRIKVIDSVTNAILFNNDVKLHDKREWSSDGYSQENRFHFEKVGNTEENSSRIFFITDKKSGRIKIMSLDNTYQLPWHLRVEYKTDERNKSDNIYELEFGYKEAKDTIDEHMPKCDFNSDDIEDSVLIRCRDVGCRM